MKQTQACLPRTALLKTTTPQLHPAPPNARSQRLALALAQALFTHGASGIMAFASVVAASATHAQAPTPSKQGTVYVYGYLLGAKENDFSVQVAGKQTTPVNGALTLRLSEGIHDIEIIRAGETAMRLPVYFNPDTQTSLLLKFDHPGSIDYRLQETTSSEVLDAGVYITPGMAANIGGTVMRQDGDRKIPAVDALVQLIGLDEYTVTDQNGRFMFPDLPAGVYRLQVMAPGIEPSEPIGFTLAAKESKDYPVVLEAALENLQEIVVTSKGISQQTMAQEEERSSAQVAEVVTTEQMKRGGDSEASGALKRVTGLSTVSGKFVYVRGMGERYSSVLLNGAQVPSPDPTRRVVPLDLFPIDVLDSVVVQKSYSADMPGEFGGGTVQLRTKEAGKAPFFKISAGMSAQDGSNFQKGIRHQGGQRDWLGFDRVRELPNELSSLTDGRPLLNSTPPAQLEAAGEAVAKLGFDTRKESLGPNANVSMSGGRSFEFSDATRLSLLGALRHANTWESFEEQRRSYGLGAQQTPFLATEVMRQSSERQVALTGFLNGTLRMGDNHRLQATSMVLRQTTDQSQLDEGYRDAPDSINQYYELEWTENSLIANQLGGEHLISKWSDLSVNWQVTDARARRDSPGKRQYNYVLEGAEYRLRLNSDGNQISYENLDDDSREYRLGLSLPYAVSDESYLTFGTGVSRVERDRDSKLRRFNFAVQGPGVSGIDVRRLRPDQIFTPQNIGPGGFVLNETTRTLDNYVAKQTLTGFFANVDWTYGEHWRVLTGVRRESNDQLVSTFDISSPASGRFESKIDDARWLPALAATYSFDEAQQQLRVSYGRSVSRPDFREYSPAPFLDPILDVESFGNVDLVPTRIDNLDVRWERYFDGDEAISAALFYKQFDQPIERVSAPGTGFLLTYENAVSADNFGLELESFMRLSRLHESLDDFFGAANLAFIESKVDLGSAGRAQTNRNRPLQGQSKYLANIQVGYKPLDSSQWEATLLYNVAGKRIAQVGDFGRADIFEEPFHQLDFTARYQLDKSWSMNFRVKNLLNESVEYTQSNLPTRLYKPGLEVGFSIEWAPSLVHK